MRSIARAAALAAALLLSSCAAVSHKFTCPARGGAEWRELRSEHVLLQTDLPEGKAEELLRDAEQMRALILAALFKQPPQLPDRIHLVAFRTDRELWEFTDEPGPGAYFATFGFVVDGTSVDPLVAVAPAWGKYRSDYLARLTNMITGQLASHLFPGSPEWYQVGLATSMETLADEDDDGRRYVGKVPDRIVLPPWEVPGALAGTLTGSSPIFGEVVVRSPAWLLVRWLSEARPAEYLAFLKQISAGSGGAAAWAAVFPDWDPANGEQMARLEAELQAFVAGGQIRYREVTAPVVPSWTARPLAPPEVHEIRIRIRRGSMPIRFLLGRDVDKDATTAEDRAKALRGRLEAESEREAAEALAEAPLHPVTLRLVAGEASIDPVRARASTGAYPKDWRAWLVLGDALGKREADGARAAYRKAAELGAGEPVAQLGIASGLLTMGDAGAALPAAGEAARLAPFSDEALVVLAASAARTGACGEALRTLRRISARLAAAKDDRLDGLLGDSLRRCGPGPGKPGSSGTAADPE